MKTPNKEFQWKGKWKVRKLSSFETEIIGPQMTRQESKELYRSEEFKSLRK